ncbi:MAG: RND transporter, partial [Pseudomonadota bacterium]|nr:RND transporter [Pseudomonadota bacterium]
MNQENFKDRRRRVRLFWIGAAALAALVITWLMWPRPVEVDVAVIDRGDLRLELVDEGRTRMHDVYTVSAPVSGRLLRVEVEPGDTVQKGMVVARMTQTQAGFLDTRSDIAARAAVDAAQAAVRAADTELELAGREHERIRSLAARQLVAQSVVDNSQARLDAARAARDARVADLARARSA